MIIVCFILLIVIVVWYGLSWYFVAKFSKAWSKAIKEKLKEVYNTVETKFGAAQKEVQEVKTQIEEIIKLAKEKLQEFESLLMKNEDIETILDEINNYNDLLVDFNENLMQISKIEAYEGDEVLENLLKMMKEFMEHTQKLSDIFEQSLNGENKE